MGRKRVKAVIQFHPETFTNSLTINPLYPLPTESVTTELLHDTNDNTYFVHFNSPNIKARYLKNNGGTGIWDCVNRDTRHFTVIMKKPIMGDKDEWQD